MSELECEIEVRAYMKVQNIISGKENPEPEEEYMEEAQKVIAELPADLDLSSILENKKRVPQPGDEIAAKEMISGVERTPEEIEEIRRRLRKQAPLRVVTPEELGWDKETDN